MFKSRFTNEILMNLILINNRTSLNSLIYKNNKFLINFSNKKQNEFFLYLHKQRAKNEKNNKNGK